MESNIEEYFKIVITPIPWIIAFFISYITFRKNDISRQKDKILSLIEKLFDDLASIIDSEDYSEDELDNLISYKASVIEIQIKSIESRSKKKIINPDLYSTIRSMPIDLLSKRLAAEKTSSTKRDLTTINSVKLNNKNALFDLSLKIISEIEMNYNSWFFRKWFFTSKPELTTKKPSTRDKIALIFLIGIIIGWFLRELHIPSGTQKCAEVKGANSTNTTKNIHNLSLK
ncbi:hypothetical protein [Aeromonas schubertii]|uniref:hypothetical protein n=1 Tax=Aeromonas schubertii TaxID=652 RepID=UPI001CC49EB7|nr:hypothetical protein [Aeromonas schubertii]MBZ6072417.1 hypothetical protein [Aeromonas schubertii]